ncbi:MAG TPA: glycosyltransferase [Chthoniobacteraceae bacterium]|jgi:glycosyltransferase involved in cell wall biosynthesis|nr:glycosyltransferase [Chthoniobacteraceae bacterium]
MKVFFAPDYREGVAYQALLAEALAERGIEVTFPVGHRRVLPLSRGIEGWEGDLLHIHWPEKFFERRHDGLDFLRKLRFPLDLALTARKAPLVVTAHDLRPHNRGGEALLHSNFQRIYHAARAIIAHSEKAAEEVALTYRVKRAKLRVIPHGDLSASLGSLPPRAGSGGPVCLMFGTVEPYKGIEPVIDWWRAAKPDATLAIAGKPFSAPYAKAIRERAGDARNIRLDLAWQTDAALRQWLADADCVMFHYRAIFTSGAACLARSLGIPVLIPNRLDTIDLAEPHPSVFRFDALETDFRPALETALNAGADFAAAASWREATAWPRIAQETARVYEECVL